MSGSGRVVDETLCAGEAVGSGGRDNRGAAYELLSF